MELQLSEALIRRLPAYYRNLKELEQAGVEHISSEALGQRMHQTASLVRWDMKYLGVLGRQGHGYGVRELRTCIGEVLGLNRPHDMIVIGAGSIGNAVTRYPGFSEDGFRVTAMFDTDPARIGGRVNGIPVLDWKDVGEYLKAHPVRIAVLAVPAAAARETAGVLEHFGIRAIWNFAPVDLQYDPRVMDVVNVHLSDTLQVLSYKIAHHAGEWEEA